MKKKILVLGAGSYQMPVIEAAKRLGLEVIAITPDGDYPGIKAADKVYFHDARDCEYALETGRREGVSGVVSYMSEIMVRPVEYAAEHMGLPGNGYETACLYTDKKLMRKKGVELGIPTIQSLTAETYEEALEAFRSIGGAAIIKPADNCSSRGVFRIGNEEELAAKWQESKGYSGSGVTIIEKFVSGRQFEVDSIAVNGNIRTLMYADLTEFSLPDVFSSATRLYPSVADDETVRRLLDYDRRVNEGFGLRHGLTHNEYIMDDESGEIYLVEAALRGGGTYIGSHIARLETGIDTADFLVKAAMGMIDDVPDFQMNRCHAGYVCFYLPLGEVISVRGADEVEALDYVEKTKFNGLREGQVIGSPEDKDQRCAVVLHGSDREDMMRKIDEIRSLIDVRVQTPDGIKGPIWE